MCCRRQRLHSATRAYQKALFVRAPLAGVCSYRALPLLRPSRARPTRRTRGRCTTASCASRTTSPSSRPQSTCSPPTVASRPTAASASRSPTSTPRAGCRPGVCPTPLSASCHSEAGSEEVGSEAGARPLVSSPSRLPPLPPPSHPPPSPPRPPLPPVTPARTRRSVATILNGVLSFMLETAPTTGSVDTDLPTKLRYRDAAAAFNDRDPASSQRYAEMRRDQQRPRATPTSAGCSSLFTRPAVGAGLLQALPAVQGGRPLHRRRRGPTAHSRRSSGERGPASQPEL